MSPYKKRAAALSFDGDQTAPIIVAAGQGQLAEKIIEIAEKNHVPVFEDDSLSTILSQLELGSPIPDPLFQAIADIYIYFLGFEPGAGKVVEENEYME